MKKFFLVLCAVFATVVLFGCSNDDDGSDTPEQKSVVELIASAKDGDTVLMTKGTLSDNESILIDKRITLSGGETQFDAKGATITITKAGVTVKNIKNIKELIVEESVGDGDVWIDTCEIQTATIKGGGADSVHFVNTKVAVMNAAKKNVRLVLEKVSRIFSMNIKETCHIDVPAVQSFVDNVIVDKSVDEVTLSGKPSITTLVTNSDATATAEEKTKIVIASNDVEITKAANKSVSTEGGTETVKVEEIVQETTSAEIVAVTYETLTEEDVKQTEKAAEDAESGKISVDDVIKDPDVNIDNSGSMTLRASSYGIQISLAVPEKTYGVNFYRAEYDEAQYKKDPAKMNWYLVGSYQKKSQSMLTGTVSYTDYYVEAGKAYSYYAKYKTGLNDNPAGISETDTITATAGRGLLKLANDVTLNIKKDTFEFSQEGFADVTNLHCDLKDVTSAISVYLRPADTPATTTIIEGTTCSYVNLTDTPTIQFLSVDHIGVPLEIAGVKCSYKYVKGNEQWTWHFVPTKAIGGTGFTNGTITFTQDELPVKIEDAPTGVKITSYPAKLAEKVDRIDITDYRDYDRETINIRPLTAGEFNSTAVYSVTEPHVTAGSTDKFTVQFRKYNAETDTQENFFGFTMFYTPKTGTGAVKLTDRYKVTYDANSQTGFITSTPDTWYENGYVLPEAYTLTVNGQPIDLARKSLNPSVGFMTKDYSYSANASFSSYKTTDGKTTYVANLFYRLNAALGLPLSAYRISPNADYRNDVYRVSYSPVDDRLSPSTGISETITLKDIYTDKTYALSSAEHGETLTFSDITENKQYATVTITSQGKGASVSRTGRADFATNTITCSDNSSGDYSFSGRGFTMPSPTTISFDDLNIVEKSPAITIDNAGSMTLAASSDGIQINVAVPEKTSGINFYRAEYDETQYKADPTKMTWYYIGNYCTKSQCAIPESSISYTDYYVEAGKTYSYYADYKSGGNYMVTGSSETDTITATGGRGLLQLPNAITVNCVKSTFDFSQEGYADATNFHGFNDTTAEEVTFGVSVYLRPAGQNETATALDSAKLSSITSLTSVPNLQFKSVDHIGIPLELVSAKATYHVRKGDAQWTWDTLPAKAIGGTGFTNGTITFTQDELPFKVSDAETGISIMADTSKVANKGRLRFSVTKTHDKDWLYIRPASGNILPDAVYTLTDSAVTPNTCNRVCIEFQEYSETTSSYTTVKQFGVLYTSKTGTGAPVWSENLKATYDEYSQTAYITSDPSTWFEPGFTLPEAITLTVDGTDYALPRTGITPAVRLKDTAYTFNSNLSFSNNKVNGIVTYVGNAFYRLNSALGKTLYPYSNNSNFKYSDSTYRVDYYPSDDRFAPIAGFPATITPKDIYTGRTYALTPAEHGETLTFSDVTDRNATVTITSQKKQYYLAGDGTLAEKDVTVTRTGTADFAKNNIKCYDENYYFWGLGFTMPSSTTISFVALNEDTYQTPIAELSAPSTEIEAGGTTWVYLSSADTSTTTYLWSIEGDTDAADLIPDASETYATIIGKNTTSEAKTVTVKVIAFTANAKTEDSIVITIAAKESSGGSSTLPFTALSGVTIPEGATVLYKATDAANSVLQNGQKQTWWNNDGALTFSIDSVKFDDSANLIKVVTEAGSCGAFGELTQEISAGQKLVVSVYTEKGINFKPVAPDEEFAVAGKAEWQLFELTYEEAAELKQLGFVGKGTEGKCEHYIDCVYLVKDSEDGYYAFDDGADNSAFKSNDGIVVIAATGSNQMSRHGIHLALGDTITVKVGSAVTISLLGCVYGADSTITVTSSAGTKLGTFDFKKATAEKDASTYTYTGEADTLTLTVTTGGNTYLHGLKIQ